MLTNQNQKPITTPIYISKSDATRHPFLITIPLYHVVHIGYTNSWNLTHRIADLEIAIQSSGVGIGNPEIGQLEIGIVRDRDC